MDEWLTELTEIIETKDGIKDEIKNDEITLLKNKINDLTKNLDKITIRLEKIENYIGNESLYLFLKNQNDINDLKLLKLTIIQFIIKKIIKQW